jgi:hypothetical protein
MFNKTSNFKATTSYLEDYVDAIMNEVVKKTCRFADYTKTVKGPSQILSVEQAEKTSKFVAVFILSSASFWTVLAAAGVGTIVRAFSREQLENSEKTLFLTLKSFSEANKALALVIAVVYMPILFPIAGGLYAGFQIGSYLPAQMIANQLENLAGTVGIKR